MTYLSQGFLQTLQSLWARQGWIHFDKRTFTCKNDQHKSARIDLQFGSFQIEMLVCTSRYFLELQTLTITSRWCSVWEKKWVKRMRRRRSKRPTSMVTARFVRCSYSSSQPSMVYWLSSSIFPCLSLVRRPAMVTPDQISIKEADLDGDGKVFALFVDSIVMRWNICNIRMLAIDQKDIGQKFPSRWGETSLWCLWCLLLSTLSVSSSETVTNNWCKCGCLIYTSTYIQDKTSQFL